MTKINVWELVNKEAATVIKAIENGEIKTRKEIRDRLEMVYNWRISDSVESLVNLYLSVNNIEMAWDYELGAAVE